MPGVNAAGNQNTTGSAATLTTARTINGTAFNGSANIITANWGTSRNLTVGNTAKAVNGAANVAWTLAEIGAFPADNVVGTLGGGAIIERGSNGNGEYVRFLDGTQHCMLTMVFYGTGPGMRLFDWAYPAAFLEGPAITGTPLAYGNTGFFRGVTGGVMPNGNTAVNLTYDMQATDAGPMSVRLFATGRWN